MKRTDKAIFMEQDEFKNLTKTFSKEQREIFEKYKQEHKDEKLAEISLYECNRLLMAKQPNLTIEDIESKVPYLEKWFEENPDTYFMLLCNELNYYTVFHQCTTTFGSFTKLAKEVLDLAMKYIGNIKVIETDTNGVIAIWGWQQEKDELPHCFYLFPYGQGVVEV